MGNGGASAELSWLGSLIQSKGVNCQGAHTDAASDLASPATFIRYPSTSFATITP